MDFLEVIKNRHSVRKFTDAPVEKEILDAIVSVARTAPSSRNSKSTEFMIVDDRDTIVAMSQMRDSGSAFMKDAAAVIVILGDQSRTKTSIEESMRGFLNIDAEVISAKIRHTRVNPSVTPLT